MLPGHGRERLKDTSYIRLYHRQIISDISRLILQYVANSVTSPKGDLDESEPKVIRVYMHRRNTINHYRFIFIYWI